MANPHLLRSHDPTRVRPKKRRGRLSSSIANWKLVLGTALVMGLLVFSFVNRSLVSEANLRSSLGGPEPPSAQHLFGTDIAGRDLFTLVAYSIPTTLGIGLLAGAVGTVVGTFLGLVTGYYRGFLDTVIRTVADITLTIPSLMVLIVIAAYVSTSLGMMSIILAAFSWPWLLRSIRSQTLSLRERAFVRLAELSGRSGLEIMLLDLLPNLLPFIAAGFVSATSEAILASVGLQLLGVGPAQVPTLGGILHLSFRSAAIWQGMWWWWLPPALILATLLIGLFLTSMALDEVANPRLREEPE